MEKNNYYLRASCRLCSKKKLQRVMRLAKCPLPDAYVTASQLNTPQELYPQDLMLCSLCGNAQLSVVVDPKIVYQNYLYKTVTSLGLVKHFDIYASDILKDIHPKKGSLIVDIGSNDGSLLASFKKKGMQVLGIDPAVKIAKEATKTGILTLPEYFTPQLADHIVKKFGQASIITSNNTLANVDDLHAFTKGVKKLLAPDGVFIIETFYIMSQMKNLVFESIYHEHMEYFTTKPFSKFFSQYDMEIIDVKNIDTKGGSIRFTVQLKGGPYKVRSSVKKQIQKESKFGINNAKVYKTFQKRIDKAKLKLTVRLDRLKKKGFTIAGYGASPTCTVLLHQFELGNRINYLFDDNELKQNRYSPNFHHPVFSPKDLSKKSPDYIVILAWRYAEPIISKNKEYLNSGGKFIIPLPNLKIIGN